jgi:hypothetical protein
LTILPNRKEGSSISIRRIVTSRSACLDLEDRYQIVLIEKGAILHREREQKRIIPNSHLLLIPPGRGSELRVAALSSLCQACFDSLSWYRPRLSSGGRIRMPATRE